MSRCITGNRNPNWRGGNLDKVCIYCGSPFSVRNGRPNAVCCSLECWNRQQRITPWKKDVGPSVVMARLGKRIAMGVSGCHEWTGCVGRHGYGRTMHENRDWVVHRLVWSVLKGPIPEGLCVCHSCDNRKCVNVEHLWLGTHEDNMRDMAVKGRRKNKGCKKDGGGFEEKEVK